MTPLGPDWKRLLDHFIEQGRLDEAEEIIRAAEATTDTADGKAMLALERAALQRQAGRTVEADTAVRAAARRFDDLSRSIQVRVDLARAEIEARRDPIAALKRAHAADERAVGLAPPHLRLATLAALLEYTRRAGITEPLLQLADAVIQQAGFTRDAHLTTAATILRAELGCELEPVATALDRAREAHATALRLAPSPTRHALARRAAGIRGRAARLAGEALEAVEAFEEAVAGPEPSPAWQVELALARQAVGESLEAHAEALSAALSALAAADPLAAQPSLGALLLGEGRLDDARRVAESMPPSILRLGLEARIALLTEEPDPVRGALVAAVSDPNTFVEARRPLLVLLAALHALAGARVDAIECLDELLHHHDRPDTALEREARIQRARLLTRFADYDDAYADADRAWRQARDAKDARGALHAGLVRAACLLGWDREKDAFDTLSEAVAIAERVGAVKVALTGRIERSLLGLSHGDEAEVARSLERLVDDTGAGRSDPSARLRTLATLAIARHAADEGDADRARAMLAGLSADARGTASRLGVALGRLVPGADESAS